MMKYLQKLGKAMMLPVAALPICGILMGLATPLLPVLWAFPMHLLPAHCTPSVSS